MDPVILIRGGGDIASGVALRLYHSGFRVIMTELEHPLTVRRTVSFSEAIYAGFTNVEGINSRKVLSFDSISNSLQNQEIPILVDEKLDILNVIKFDFQVLIDARMEKKPQGLNFIHTIPLVIGIGPGFTAGYDCHVVIESSRGHFLGHIYRQGNALPDTGQPSGDSTRILRAPVSGTILTHVPRIFF